MNEKILTIIPAREGSKRLANKNIRTLGNKPLIVHTIEAALASRYKGKVMVSTDSENIAEIARRAGAEVPFLRPKSLAGDEVSSLAVLQNALSYMESERGYSPDIVTFLQPTSPFRTAEHIDKAVKLLKENDVMSVLGLSEVRHQHPYWMFVMDGNEKVKPMIEMDKRPLQTQSLPPLYAINGSLYTTKRDYYYTAEENDPVFSYSAKGLVMDWVSSVDIDDMNDFKVAESLWEIKDKKEANPVVNNGRIQNPQRFVA